MHQNLDINYAEMLNMYIDFTPASREIDPVQDYQLRIDFGMLVVRKTCWIRRIPIATNYILTLARLAYDA